MMLAPKGRMQGQLGNGKRKWSSGGQTLRRIGSLIRAAYFGTSAILCVFLNIGQSFMGENGLKLLLTGDSGVGKSSILVRFTDDHFDAE